MHIGTANDIKDCKNKLYMLYNIDILLLIKNDDCKIVDKSMNNVDA